MDKPSIFGLSVGDRVKVTFGEKNGKRIIENIKKLPLQCRIGNDRLLELYGSMRFSSIWTYNQAWASATRQWEAGNRTDASAMFGNLRQQMLQIHLDLYPEDPLWNIEKEDSI